MSDIAERIDALDQALFDEAAQAAADDLLCRYSALVVLEPGDATRYMISIVATAPSPRPPGRRVRASLRRLGQTPWSEIDEWLSTR